VLEKWQKSLDFTFFREDCFPLPEINQLAKIVVTIKKFNGS